jgi:hypothetical protein
LSFDNELISGNLLKIRGWASQLVVISGNEDTSGHQLLLLKASNSGLMVGRAKKDLTLHPSDR